MNTQSETIGKIVEALSKAQRQFDPIIKDVKAHHHKYAPLDTCFKSTRKSLNDNGLIVTQNMDINNNDRSILVTVLAHTSGEFFKSYTDLEQLITSSKGTNPLHTWGSIITFTRRYAYLSIIGAIGEEEDNDGVDVQNKNIKVFNEPLATQLINLIKSSGCDVGEFTKFHNISSKDMITVKRSIDNFDELLINFRDSRIKYKEEE